MPQIDDVALESKYYDSMISLTEDILSNRVSAEAATYCVDVIRKAFLGLMDVDQITKDLTALEELIPKQGREHVVSAWDSDSGGAFIVRRQNTLRLNMVGESKKQMQIATLGLTPEEVNEKIEAISNILKSRGYTSIWPKH